MEFWMNNFLKECLVLDKAIYRLVQAARQFHQKLTQMMEIDMGFSQCLADESLLMGTTEKGTVVVRVYNGDRLCASNKYAIKEFKE